MSSFLKQPDEILDYDIDLGKWFGAWAPDDSITSVSLVVASEEEEVVALVVGPGDHPDTALIGTPATRFKVWLGEGTDGVTYKITFMVETTQGRRKEIDVYVLVRSQ